MRSSTRTRSSSFAINASRSASALSSPAARAPPLPVDRLTRFAGGRASLTQPKPAGPNQEHPEEHSEEDPHPRKLVHRLLRMNPVDAHTMQAADSLHRPWLAAVHTLAAVSRAASKSCAGSAHGPTRISISPGSSTGSRSTPRKRSSVDRQLQPRRTGFAGLEHDLRHAFQLERRARHARDAIAHEQEHGFLGRTSAFVRDVDGHFDRIFGRRGFRAHGQVRVSKPAVAEPEAERNQRRARRVEILAREMVLRILRPARVALTVEQRNLTERARPRDRRSAATATRGPSARRQWRCPLRCPETTR